ncbi:MAG: potassium channel family protein, partial [Bacteroidota bacterium]
LISGYLSLGLIGFFICMSVEVADPGSFRGLGGDPKLFVELIYYSYITLLTIGYGDIIPVTNLARNSSVLIGLVGQMYLVIITAVVVGKYIGQHQTTREV